jgi:hypothetical protein
LDTERRYRGLRYRFAVVNRAVVNGHRDPAGARVQVHPAVAWRCAGRPASRLFVPSHFSMQCRIRPAISSSFFAVERSRSASRSSAPATVFSTSSVAGRSPLAIMARYDCETSRLVARDSADCQRSAASVSPASTIRRARGLSFSSGTMPRCSGLSDYFATGDLSLS